MRHVVPAQAGVIRDGGTDPVGYVRVKVFRDATGLAVDFRTEGEFPAYGNNEDRADGLAVDLVASFLA